MQIAILGGTGDFGAGLALRIGRDTDATITIGSRDESKATASAEAYTATLTEHGGDSSIRGADNATAVAGADIVVLSVPAYYISDTMGSITEMLSPETILVSPAVGMKSTDSGVQYNPPESGSVAELAAELAPESVSVVGAFTNLSAERLSDLETEVILETPVIGDSQTAKDAIFDLISKLDRVQGIDAGPLSHAAEVESLTPLLINIDRYSTTLSSPYVRFE